MELYSGNEKYKLYKGNMLDMLEVIEPNSIDSIVCDPPYEIGFMNKGWDSTGIAFKKETWEKCFKVLKAGGHLVAFSGSRVHHRMMCAIEDAGFEIRDCIMWLYGSAMPKSLNIGFALDKKNGIDNTTGVIKTDGKATDSGSGCYNCNNGNSTMAKEYQERIAQNKWKGWGTQLKPSYEVIVLARKPVEGSIIENVEKYGVGGINIDECRVGDEKRTYKGCSGTSLTMIGGAFEKGTSKEIEFTASGRFPANTILTYDDETFDEVCGDMPSSKSSDEIRHNNQEIYSGKGIYGKFSSQDTKGFADEGSNARFYKNCPYDIEEDFDIYYDNLQRYFYCGKATKEDRDEGLDDFESAQGHSKGNGLDRVCEFCGVSQLTPELCHCEVKSWVAKPKKNIHTTVKPQSLMRYLVRLVTPPNGTVLDPFNGSGSTGKATMCENNERNTNYKYIGIELTDEYLPISKARIEYVQKQGSMEIKESFCNEDVLEKTPIQKQISMFD